MGTDFRSIAAAAGEILTLTELNQRRMAREDKDRISQLARAIIARAEGKEKKHEFGRIARELGA